MGLKFEWDPRKAAANFRKHGVGFEEAASAFGDSLSLTIADPEHSVAEHRWVLLGTSAAGRLVVVVHTEEDDTVRIISARLASRGERRAYEEGTT